MIRTSSVLRRTVPAVGALLAAAALSACGGVAHPGAAAVVGSERISIATVQARVAEVRDEAAAEPAGYQEPADLVQATVGQLVRIPVVAHALATHNLTVSDTEVLQARQQLAQNVGGEATLDQLLLVKQAVPTDQIDAFFRESVGYQKLAALSGQQVGTAAGNAAVQQLLAQSAADLKVTVNPRYGSWDDQQVSLDAPSAAWLPQPPTAA
ncbi:hypothetical protein P3T36_001369 [Kitasatospora sp. MAP12-15]|uniref:hypothetical protein n=1 Tax=unclassified Kitasatospora TaxID=2633591 RepID=UPI002473BFBD|nr:hypothetical protein [Kitasatospora sp. MAP12-44]MDH6112486.1 hypothetical protein [Kitasatospora sp. MAP12-44]